MGTTPAPPARSESTQTVMPPPPPLTSGPGGQYERVLRAARAHYLRRDLATAADDDEVPLYFAWERLYAVANGRSLAVDWADETPMAAAERRLGRLPPRRGLPPPPPPRLRSSSSGTDLRRRGPSARAPSMGRTQRLSLRSRAIMARIERELRSSQFLVEKLSRADRRLGRVTRTEDDDDDDNNNEHENAEGQPPPPPPPPLPLRASIVRPLPTRTTRERTKRSRRPLLVTEEPVVIHKARVDDDLKTPASPKRVTFRPSSAVVDPEAFGATGLSPIPSSHGRRATPAVGLKGPTATTMPRAPITANQVIRKLFGVHQANNGQDLEDSYMDITHDSSSEDWDSGEDTTAPVTPRSSGVRPRIASRVRPSSMSPRPRRNPTNSVLDREHDDDSSRTSRQTSFTQPEEHVRREGSRISGTTTGTNKDGGAKRGSSRNRTPSMPRDLGQNVVGMAEYVDETSMYAVEGGNDGSEGDGDSVVEEEEDAVDEEEDNEGADGEHDQQVQYRVDSDSKQKQQGGRGSVRVANRPSTNLSMSMPTQVAGGGSGSGRVASHRQSQPAPHLETDVRQLAPQHQQQQQQQGRRSMGIREQQLASEEWPRVSQSQLQSQSVAERNASMVVDSSSRSAEQGHVRLKGSRISLTTRANKDGGAKRGSSRNRKPSMPRDLGRNVVGMAEYVDETSMYAVEGGNDGSEGDGDSVVEEEEDEVDDEEENEGADGEHDRQVQYRVDSDSKQKQQGGRGSVRVANRPSTNLSMSMSTNVAGGGTSSGRVANHRQSQSAPHSETDVMQLAPQHQQQQQQQQQQEGRRSMGIREQQLASAEWPRVSQSQLQSQSVAERKASMVVDSSSRSAEQGHVRREGSRIRVTTGANMDGGAKRGSSRNRTPSMPRNLGRNVVEMAEYVDETSMYAVEGGNDGSEGDGDSVVEEEEDEVDDEEDNEGADDEHDRQVQYRVDSDSKQKQQGGRGSVRVANRPSTNLSMSTSTNVAGGGTSSGRVASHRQSQSAPHSETDVMLHAPQHQQQQQQQQQQQEGRRSMGIREQQLASEEWPRVSQSQLQSQSVAERKASMVVDSSSRSAEQGHVRREGSKLSIPLATQAVAQVHSPDDQVRVYDPVNRVGQAVIRVAQRQEQKTVPAAELSETLFFPSQEYLPNTTKPLKVKTAVWPPGMQHEVQRAHISPRDLHPLAPPGLEHLITEEQMNDYWTWLHWYSCWQLYYLQLAKANKGAKGSGKRRRRREPPNAAASYCKNANWWLDLKTVVKQAD